MNAKKKRLNRLEDSLKDIYRRRDLGDGAETDEIMRRVRRLARPGSIHTPLELELAEARRIFSRFAAGAAFAAVLAAIYALTAGYGPEYELLRIYALDPAGMLLMPLLGA